MYTRVVIGGEEWAREYTRLRHARRDETRRRVLTGHQDKQGDSPIVVMLPLRFAVALAVE
jgi:hypothetical protein